MRTATVKYHDGLDYDMNEYSRLIIEGSSRNITKENIDHTQEDMVKALYSSIEILNAFVCRHAAASFSSLCTTINLSTTKMGYTSIGDYIQTEVRHADIPNTFNNRVSWMEVFELVAHLFTSLREQETIMQTIKKEISGIFLVKDTDRALHVLNEISDRPLL